jgi:hypothetical protein
LNIFPSDINTDYRHIAKPWPLCEIFLIGIETFIYTNMENKEFPFFTVIGVGLLITCSLMFFVGPEMIQAKYYYADSKDRGPIGDAFGGTLSPVIAWIAAVLTFVAFYVQYRANEQQKIYIKQQRFEDNFFRLLDNHQQIVGSFDLRDEKDVSRVLAQGRECFKRMYKQFVRMHRRIYKSDDSIDAVNATYHIVQENHKADLHHYFRFLYHILKFVRNSEIPDSEKQKYASILRANLSAYELIFIFYNGLHDYGVTHFKPLLEEFSFLKNLDYQLLLSQGHQNEYHKLAFASSSERTMLINDWKRLVR